MLVTLKKIAKPLAKLFFRSDLYLYYLGPTQNLFRLWKFYSIILLVQNLWMSLTAIFHRHRYVFCSGEDILSKKKSDILFVFGSGASLNEISAEEWEEIKKHNSIGVNYFIHQQFIDLDFQFMDGLDQCGGMLRAGAITAGRPRVLLSKFKFEAHRYGKIISENKFLRNTIFFIPTDIFCKPAVVLMSAPNLPRNTKIFSYKMRYDGAKIDSMRFNGPPWEIGSRLPGSLSGAISVGAMFGWKHIVLIGVDLYDSRYFYLKANETRSGRGKHKASDPHPNYNKGRIPQLVSWAKNMNQAGVKLSVYNPKSLLAGHINVFEWDKI